jgi:two-component system, sensor histidine kinase RegB
MKPIPRFTEHPKAGSRWAVPGPPLLLRPRLQTLITLRWIAVVGQLSAVLIVYYLFDFPLPFWQSLAVISLSATLNIFLRFHYGTNVRLRNRYVAMFLSYDIIHLAVLIYLTGGLANPFSLLFLVPATISASTIKVKYTIWLGLLTVVCITLLIPFHLPLPWGRENTIQLPLIYLIGVWAALVCSLLFMGAYSWRIANEAREMANALFATEKVLAREQKLTALDGLAAAAAHELGTPLATIALVAKELRREIPDGIDASEDLDLLMSQTVRCRKILANLTRGGSEGDALFERVEIDAMLAEIMEPYKRDLPVELVRLQSQPPGLPTPIVSRNPGIHFGLETLIENAVGFAREKVTVKTSWSEEKIVVIVEDDGPGISPAVIDRLGEPYVTTRPVNPEKIRSPEDEGMGLGFFIAKTLLERSGGKIIAANKKKPRSGAIITVTWPRSAIVARASDSEIIYK